MQLEGEEGEEGEEGNPTLMHHLYKTELILTFMFITY
jgi:hypothetical protein